MAINKELRQKIIDYNHTVAAQREKAADMDIIIAAIAALPPGQQNKFLTDEVMAVLAKYCVE